MESRVTSEEADGTVAVHVQVRLDARDQRRVFAAGDHLIQLPCRELQSEAGGTPIQRSAIFLSELAGMPQGFTRLFVDQDSARAFQIAVAGQLKVLQEELEGA